MIRITTTASYQNDILSLNEGLKEYEIRDRCRKALTRMVVLLMQKAEKNDVLKGMASVIVSMDGLKAFYGISDAELDDAIRMQLFDMVRENDGR